MTEVSQFTVKHQGLEGLSAVVQPMKSTPLYTKDGAQEHVGAEQYSMEEGNAADLASHLGASEIAGYGYRFNCCHAR